VQATGFFFAALAARPQSSLACTYLASALGKQGKLSEAVALARKAIRLQGDNALAHLDLSWYLLRQGRYAEAEAVCQDFIKRVRADYHRIYLNLSFVLQQRGNLKDAKAAAEKSTQLQPSYSRSWIRLGEVLLSQEKYSDAEGAFRKAFQLDSESALGLNGVADSLRLQGKLAAAEEFCWEVIRARPKFAPAYFALAAVRWDEGKLTDAEAECRKAIQEWPNYAAAHSLLGSILFDQERYSEAFAANRTAVTLEPRDSRILSRYGASLREAGALEEAESCLREAIMMGPQFAWARFRLGFVQFNQGKYSAAETSFQTALDLEPNQGRAYVRLGDALKFQGKFTAALTAYRRRHELGLKEPRWTYNTKWLIQEAEQLVEVDVQLASGLKEGAGSSRSPSPLIAARACAYKRLTATAARFFTQTFTAQPKLVEDCRNLYRYDAACCAALAGCGRGEDSAKFDEKERAQWRQQALDWLRADLKQWTRQLVDATPKDRDFIRPTLQHWQRDSDFDGVRDAKSLTRLPTGERAAWQQFWADVAALLKTVETTKWPCSGPEKRMQLGVPIYRSE
jgi:tetratricopeptide (TPR) repeat protein